MVVGYLVGATLTGNAIINPYARPPPVDEGGGYTTTSPTNTTVISTYMDPKGCYYKEFDRFDAFSDDAFSVAVNCDLSGIGNGNSFVGKVTNVGCPNGADPFLSGYAWWGDALGSEKDTLPTWEQYTCMEDVSNQWVSPYFISAFCCEIKDASGSTTTTASTTGKTLKTMKVDPVTGKATIA